ncbi:unnamed protein product [marine sediment metagenome]|uniref:Uncharacterized protein n=1 Tax=marine sediment metagenome TaxID=412755 RepID=X1DZM5_9ZZZZ
MPDDYRPSIQKDDAELSALPQAQKDRLCHALLTASAPFLPEAVYTHSSG